MKLKMKPSERIKVRYVLIEAENRESVEKAILDYIGILGWARATPFFVKENGKRIILSVSRKEIDNIRAAFELCKDKIRVLRVSGTLKGLGK